MVGSVFFFFFFFFCEDVVHRAHAELWFHLQHPRRRAFFSNDQGVEALVCPKA